MKQFSNVLLRVLELLMTMGLLGIVMIVILQVMLASFHSSLTGANEIITKLFAYLTSIGAATVLGRREHIAITFGVEKMPLGVARFVESLGLLCVAMLNVVVVVYSVRWISVTGDYRMPTTQLPRIVAQCSIPAGCALAAFFCGVRIGELLTGNSEASATGANGP